MESTPPQPTSLSPCGRARFTVLTSRLIRLEWSPIGQFEDRPSINFTQRHAGRTDHVSIAHSDDGSFTIETDHVLLRWSVASGVATSWNDALSITVKNVGKLGTVSWIPGTADTGNLGGTVRTLDGVSGPTTLSPGLISRDGWVVYDDSQTPVLARPETVCADVAASTPSNMWQRDYWPVSRASSTSKDWYFFGHGHDYVDALHDYTTVAGRIPLPPRWSFGVWWSRYWPYTEDEFKLLVAEFRDHDVPLDVLVIDMDWHQDGWTGYSWNPACFKDPVGFLAWCKDQGLAVTLNLHPADGVAAHETAYTAVCDAVGKPADGTVVPFNVTDKSFMSAYFKCLHHPLEADGVDFWWIDWQQGSRCDVPGLDTMFWLNHLHVEDMARTAETTGKRPLILSRWAGLGNHRYQIGFSGDTYSNWESLEFQVKMTACAGNVCYPYWSHDIGGHFPGTLEPELYVRWIQWAVFNPFVRTHSTRNAAAERRIWAFPEQFFHVARDAFHLRYSLLPYIYTAARQAYDTGLPLNRPLYYEWPEHDEAYTFQNCYLFGCNLLCCPVVSAVEPASGLATVTMWFPPGIWYNWFTGKRFAGPCVATVACALHNIPVFARAGSITPTAPRVLNSRQASTEPITLNVFPGSDGTYRLYTDDGASIAYTRGACTWTDISMSTQGGIMTIKIAPSTTDSSFRIRLASTWPPTAIALNGTPVVCNGVESCDTTACVWWYELSTFSTFVLIPSMTSTIDLSVILSNVSTSLIDSGVRGIVDTIERVVSTYADKCPPEVSELQELLAAIGLSCTFGSTEDAGAELHSGYTALLQDRIPLAATALLMAGASNRPLHGATAAAIQLLSGSDERAASVIRRCDPYICACHDDSTGALVPVAFQDRVWMKWVKSSKGHLVSMREGSSVSWVEFDDNGAHFADFKEMWFEGNCAKCLSIAIYDDRRSMWVKMSPGDLAWSHDGATWHPISTGKWVPA